MKQQVSILIPIRTFNRLIDEKNRKKTTLSRVIVEAIENYYRGIV